MTTKGAIKLLPIDEKLKLQVLKMYDYMEPAQKLTIERIAWNAYDLTREQRNEENVERHLEKISEGQDDLNLGSDFYAHIVSETDREIKKDMHESGTAVDLTAARQAMEQIIQETKIAKATKKAA